MFPRQALKLNFQNVKKKKKPNFPVNKNKKNSLTAGQFLLTPRRNKTSPFEATAQAVIPFSSEFKLQSVKAV